MDQRRHSLVRAAWLNTVLHLAGLGCALLMRPGTARIPLDERMRFLASDPWQWKLGWAVWLVCGAAMLWFFIRLGHKSVWVVGVALTVDAAGDFGQALWLPAVAQTDKFLLAEQTVGVAGLVVANGLYTAAVAWATWALGAKRARFFGLWVVLCGTLMVVAGLVKSPQLLEIITGPLVLAVCAWSLAMAYHR